MGIAEIRAAREAERQAKVATWKTVIDKAVEATPAVKQDDVKAAAAALKLPESLAWVSIEGVMPEGTLEAWVDTEGVLDIEVPRDIIDELAAYVEGSGIRCGVEVGPWTDRAVLHLSIYEEPPAPVEPPAEPEGEEV